MSSYPATRLRRTRASAWSRALHRETVLTPADLIWPLFVTEGSAVEDPIASLPGVSRWSVDGIAARARDQASGHQDQGGAPGRLAAWGGGVSQRGSPWG